MENGKVQDVNQYFLTLVLSLSAAVMQHLGRMTNPLTGKIEHDLVQARTAIDMLQMIKEKTFGNLTQEEELLLANTLSELQLVYVEELKKEEAAELKH